MLTYTKFSIAGLLLSMCLVGAVQGQNRTMEQLVGAAQKEWVYERFEQYMGDKNRCKKGESWAFHRDGKVTIKKCQGDRTVTEEKRWVIQSQSDLDVMLKVDDKEYLMLFVAAPPRGNRKEKLILRKKSESKSAATTDLIFYHEVD